MSLSHLMNGKAFKPDHDDLTYPQAARLGSSKAVFACISDESVRLSLVQFSKGVAFSVDSLTEVQTQNFASAIQDFVAENKGVSSIIVGLVEINALSLVRSANPGKPAPLDVANRLRTSKGVEELIGGRLNPAYDPLKFYLPVQHKTHNANVVLGWLTKRLDLVMESLADLDLPVSGFISCPERALDRITNGNPEFFKTSDLLVRDGHVLVSVLGSESGQWSSAIYYFLEADADQKIRSLMNERKRSVDSARKLTFVDFGGAPEFDSKALTGFVDEGDYLDPEAATLLILGDNSLCPSKDLRQVFSEPRPVLSKSLSWIPKFAVALTCAALLAAFGLGAVCFKTSKARDAAASDRLLAEAENAAALKAKSDLDALLKTSFSYARWLNSGVDPQRITKMAIDSMAGCRVDMLTVKPEPDRGIRIEMDITPDPNPPPGTPSVSSCINSFQDALGAIGLKFFSGSQPVAAGKIRYEATFITK